MQEDGSLRHPPWLRKRFSIGDSLHEMKKLLSRSRLNTVCQSARCPNIGECFSSGTATFMILGDRCTRNCRFCAVEHGVPIPLDPKEPHRVAEAARRLGLTYVVVTSVTRDDLPDGGGIQFASVIRAIHGMYGRSVFLGNPWGVRVEVLTPDFSGNWEALWMVVEAGPDVYNHNLETVPRLYAVVRPEADYDRSLELLQQVKRMDSQIFTKSGLMVGLGEGFNEIVGVMKDLRFIGCDFLTIGQYLQPMRKKLPVVEFIPPERFREYETIARGMGFLSVACGPFVRSSFKADELYRTRNAGFTEEIKTGEIK